MKLKLDNSETKAEGLHSTPGRGKRRGAQFFICTNWHFAILGIAKCRSVQPNASGKPMIHVGISTQNLIFGSMAQRSGFW